jgi:hypothetical protein
MDGAGRPHTVVYSTVFKVGPSGYSSLVGGPSGYTVLLWVSLRDIFKGTMLRDGG